MNEISLSVKLIIFNLVGKKYGVDILTISQNRKSKRLQWKVLHRIIYTEERLQKMIKSPNGSWIYNYL
jgi:hypothetical protein